MTSEIEQENKIINNRNYLTYVIEIADMSPETPAQGARPSEITKVT